VHARLGFFQQGHDARNREGDVGAQAGAVDAERAQAHFAHDEARAKLDAGGQQGLEVADAALGTSLAVPTLDGEASVKVPPGTQPDSVLRLKGKGLPRFGGSGRGDLLLRVQVHVPERLSFEEQKLYERLQSLSRKDKS